MDDELPTLAEVFSRVPQHIGFDIEVCLSTHVKVLLLMILFHLSVVAMQTAAGVQDILHSCHP